MRRTIRLALAALVAVAAALAAVMLLPAAHSPRPRAHRASPSAPAWPVPAPGPLLALLPTAADLPAGYTYDPTRHDRPAGQVHPYACQHAAMVVYQDHDAGVTVQADFTLPGPEPQVLTVMVSAFDRSPAGVFTTIDQTTTRCARFRVGATTMQMEPVAPPAVGRRATAAELTAAGRDGTVVYDVLYTQVGHCIVAVMSGGPAGPDVELWEATARSTAARFRGAC